MARRIISLVLMLSMLFLQSGFAQTVAMTNLPGFYNQGANPSLQNTYRPVHLRYFSYNPSTEDFRLLVDKGSQRDLSTSEVNNESQALLKYFLIGVALPNDCFWVNLRPDAADKVIDDRLANTDIGKIFLEADVQLKKDTAIFTSPETALGQEYWDAIYNKAHELFGMDSSTIPTLTRPWIVPGEVIIREANGSAYVYKATLKVMLEQDHLKGSGDYNFKDEKLSQLNEYSSQIIREKILPALTKEVNTSKKYAALRQVYYSLILAQWFKTRFSGKPGEYSGLIDSQNLSGLTSRQSWSKMTYFNEYARSFNDGEYNLKKQVKTPYGQVVRTYFSGGITLASNVVPGAGNTNPGSGAFTGNAGRDVADTLAQKDPGASALLGGNAGNPGNLDNVAPRTNTETPLDNGGSTELISSKVVKGQDIRGIADEQLTDEVVESLAKGYAAYLMQQTKRTKGLTVVVGADTRLSSPRIAQAVSRALMELGVNVIDVTKPIENDSLQPSSTPMAYKSVKYYNADGCIMITASHLPKEYNGLKFVIGTDSLTSKQVKEVVGKGNRKEFIAASVPGTYRQEFPFQRYLQENIAFVRQATGQEKPLEGRTVVVDAGNGTSGFFTQIMEALGARVIGMYLNPDGNFPNHKADPDDEETLVALKKAVVEQGADMGIAFDSDGDRVGFVSDNGKKFTGDQLLAFLSQNILKVKPGTKIVINERCSIMVSRAIEAAGGRVVYGATGYTYIKAKMQEEGIDTVGFGGEDSGHVMFPENSSYDDGMFTGLKALIYLIQDGRKLSEVQNSFEKTVTTGNLYIEFKPEAKEQASALKHSIAAELKQKIRDAGFTLLNVDALVIDFPGKGRVTIRPSMSLDELGMKVEGMSQQDVNEIIDALRPFLMPYSDQLNWQPVWNAYKEAPLDNGGWEQPTGTLMHDVIVSADKMLMQGKMAQEAASVILDAILKADLRKNMIGYGFYGAAADIMDSAARENEQWKAIAVIFSKSSTLIGVRSDLDRFFASGGKVPAVVEPRTRIILTRTGDANFDDLLDLANSSRDADDFRARVPQAKRSGRVILPDEKDIKGWMRMRELADRYFMRGPDFLLSYVIGNLEQAKSLAVRNARRVEFSDSQVESAIGKLVIIASVSRDVGAFMDRVNAQIASKELRVPKEDDVSGWQALYAATYQLGSSWVARYAEEGFYHAKDVVVRAAEANAPLDNGGEEIAEVKIGGVSLKDQLQKARALERENTPDSLAEARVILRDILELSALDDLSAGIKATLSQARDILVVVERRLERLTETETGITVDDGGSTAESVEAIIDSREAAEREVSDGGEAPALDNGGSADPAAADAPGGIDFRSIPMLSSPMGVFEGLLFNFPKLSSLELKDIDLASEAEDMSRLVKSGIVPSEDRIKVFVAACYQKPGGRQYLSDAILCLSDICKLEEMTLAETPDCVREVMVAVDLPSKKS